MAYVAIHTLSQSDAESRRSAFRETLAYFNQSDLLCAKDARVEISNPPKRSIRPKVTPASLALAAEALENPQGLVCLMSPRPIPGPTAVDSLLYVSSDQDPERGEPLAPFQRVGANTMYTVAVREDRAAAVFDSPDHWLRVFNVLDGMIGYVEVSTPWEFTVYKATQPPLA